MSIASSLSVRTKLFASVGLSVAALATVGGVAWTTIQKVKVNGPIDQARIMDFTLQGDAEPPPIYMVEAYATALELNNTTDPARTRELRDKLAQLHKDFDDRMTFYAGALVDPQMRDLVLVRNKAAAEAFLDTLEHDYLPAVAKGDHRSAAAILDGQLRVAYRDQRATVDAVNDTAQSDVDAQNARTAVLVRRRMQLMAAVIAGLAVLTGGMMSLVVRKLNRWFTEAASLMAAVTRGEFDHRLPTASTDETGRLSASMNATVAALAANRTLARDVAAIGQVKVDVAKATSVADAVRSALDSIRAAFGWTYGSYWAMDAAAKVLRFGLESGTVSDDFRRATAAAEFTEGAGLPGQAWRSRDLVFVPDLGQMPGAPRAAAAHRAGVKSGISFPLMLDGKVVGTMDFLATEMLAPTPERLAALRDVGQNVSEAIERIERNDRELRQGQDLRRKVDEMLVVVQAAAAGDLTRPVTVTGEDAIGQLGQGLGDFLGTLRASISGIAANAQAVAGSSEELTAVSHQMSANAEETSAQAGVVSAAAEQVSRSVQTVATASEQMGIAINEISKGASESARVATSAVVVAEQANATVAKLGVSSTEIGGVIKLITSIAQQTNLLALNATIEAARAGEAGKGFAVVANEVKELAKETTKATEDISARIAAIQADTQSAVSAIKQVGGVINQINDLSNTIASAVEEQTATTKEMNRNIAEAARCSTEIAANITGVAQAAEGTSGGATQTQTAAGELARMADDLQRLVGQFKYADGAPMVSPTGRSTPASVGELASAGPARHAA